MLAMRKVSPASKAPVLPRRVAAPARLVCRAQKQEQEQQQNSVRQAAVAGLVAAALLSSAIVPEEALAAGSSGRAGGSSGFSSRKFSGSSRSNTVMRSSSSTTVVSPTVVVAPPVYAAPMFSPFGGFGFGFAPTFVMPFAFGGLFQIFFLMAIVSVIFNVVKGFADAAAKEQDRKDDDWGKL